MRAFTSHLSGHIGAAAVAEPLVNLEIFVTFQVSAGGEDPRPHCTCPPTVS